MKMQIWNFIVNNNVPFIEWFDNAVECDSNVYLHKCPYMFRSSYDYLQKAQ
jgi:hypothetical protein